MSINVTVLKHRLVSAFGAHYLLNDEAHREEHFEDVFKTGRYINQTLSLGFPDELILMAAYLHDLFAWSRRNHHELASEFVLGTCHPLLTSLFPRERELLAMGCLHHRASYTGDFQGPFDELINAADRGLPKPVSAIVDRAISFRVSRGYSGPRSALVANAVKHVQEKYGRGGYARYPEMYMKCFQEEVETLRREIDEINYLDYL